ncbi:hypothetical protein KM176_16660 [Pseudooceanicola sp. CBS1P-1]|uniref:Uncharacterized protein n=1 Tax=Pseudooceanicola albus TaxID=2692189 RepID=A0A6L7G719_9RHOB|nr:MULTISPECIES: hypothetical protein [Pseudooceanicola]MBT9385508.1 hypothetical protein [Pseudooceanicola endophyticus]MXN19080.1 hypothetical protein [Pseudooceanicola albus]
MIEFREGVEIGGGPSSQKMESIFYAAIQATVLMTNQHPMSAAAGLIKIGLTIIETADKQATDDFVASLQRPMPIQGAEELEQYIEHQKAIMRRLVSSYEKQIAGGQA